MSTISPTLAWARRLTGIAFVAIAVCAVLFLVFAVISFAAPDLLDADTSHLGFDLDGFSIGFDKTMLTGSTPQLAHVQVLVWALPFAGVLYIIHQLRRLLNDLGGKTPFTIPNATRISRIGAAIMAMTTVLACGSYALGSYMANTLAFPGVTFRTNLQFPYCSLFVGLLVMLLAEIFRYGARLQEDNDLTV